MKGMRVGLFTCVAILAVLFVAGWTLAGEGKADTGGKTGKGAAEASEELIKSDQGQKTPLENRLMQVQLAIESFAAAHNHRLPQDINGLAGLLENGENDLVNPETGRPVLMNKAMPSGSDDRIKKPSEFATFWADQPTQGKGRAVIFANRVIKYLSEDEFKKVVAASVFPKLTVEDMEARMVSRETARETRQEAKRAAREKKSRSTK